ncbi:barstar family protein [Paractinoplanes globisporus]|uniref:Barstar family protein n=1 Tax=Paractinoplanes globisporus TaxID=113565 RepID=A0ABW6WVB2_9ACTN|nr:barstar family protein [Actinoplanes globisporus]
MAAFDPEVELTHPADYRLMMSTFVTLFWRSGVLNRSVDQLVALGYDVVHVDAMAWTAEQDLHRDIAAALNFPSYYGHNLPALNDCLGDVGSMEYGTSPAATGLALVLSGYDKFFAIEPYVAHSLLDIFARQARHAALIGNRMMCLVQTDDPQIAFAPVGAVPVEWNQTEWLTSSRRPG